MTTISGRLRRRLFGLSPDEASFARRGFRGGAIEARSRLECLGRTFLHGYHTALEVPAPSSLAGQLNRLDEESRGFAFEGAAMGLALLDLLTPRPGSRWRAFTDGPAEPHAYIVHVGLGWALARIPRRIEPVLARVDPILGWLALDGFGFHEGFFHWRSHLAGAPYPRRVSGYARRAFDQGLGRSLWFVDGADVRRIPETIDSFAAGRRADLWSGAGLAAAYAGGVDREGLEALRLAGGEYRPHIAQGAAFAAKARARAGNAAVHTNLACEVLGGVSAEDAARVTDEALSGLHGNGGPEPTYEAWRRRIRTILTAAGGGVRSGRSGS